jgi:hypothetical protein
MVMMTTMQVAKGREGGEFTYVAGLLLLGREFGLGTSLGDRFGRHMGYRRRLIFCRWRTGN